MKSLIETIDILKEKLAERIFSTKIQDVRIGVFFTGIKLNSGDSGVAFTPIGEMPEAVCCPKTAARMPKAGDLRSADIREVIDEALSPNVMRSALGVAAINALSAHLLSSSDSEYELREDEDAFKSIDIKKDQRIALVGAFTPYIREIKSMGNPFHIIEKNPATLRSDELKYYVPAESAAEVLPQSDIAIVTGTAIVNHTIDSILSLIKEEAKVAVIGPTASMIPDAFFKRGVDVMGGIRISDPDKMLRIIAEGGSGYHLFRQCARRITVIKRW
jgi:uncharacterized protein (DUF4213/DUF364 family)